MKRKIYNKLLDWKNKRNGATAVLIEGARRIGKSYIVEEFARNEYDSYLLIDFNKADKVVWSWFDTLMEDLDTLLMNLQILYGTRLTPGKSVIVFDEVQLCPRARAAIKYLVADGRFHYIETGSLVSIKKNVRDIVIPSEEEAMPMFPMDFEEFLWAMGNDMLMPYIRQCFEKRQPMGALHRKAVEYFRTYMIVGGMPQAVQTFVDFKDFDKVDQVKRGILQVYVNDISKYAAGLEHKVKNIFEQIPAQLQKHEKKFRLSALEAGAAYRDYDEDGAHWYSREDGHEYALTRYDDLRFLALMPKLRDLEIALVEVDPEEYTGVQRVDNDQRIALHNGVVSAQGAISAYDLMGRRVASGNGSLDISAMPHGVYIIHTAAGTMKVAR